MFYNIIIHVREFCNRLSQLVQNFPDIAINANRAFPDILRRIGFSKVDADIGRLRILRCHPPERIFYNHRRVRANAQFQIQTPHPVMSAEKFGIPLRRVMPAFGASI